MLQHNCLAAYKSDGKRDNNLYNNTIKLITYIWFILAVRIPKHVERRQRWMTVLQKKIRNFKCTQHSVLCRQHFAADCFITTATGKYYLKPDAIPSRFNTPLKKQYNLIEQVRVKCQFKYTHFVSIYRFSHSMNMVRTLSFIDKSASKSGLEAIRLINRPRVRHFGSQKRM